MQGELGPPSTYEGTAEEYNGSSWTNAGEMNTARAQGAASKNGSQTATISFVGRTAPGAVALNESYNGSSWTEVGDVNTAVRAQPGGTGTSTAALKIGGAGPPIKADVESWDGSSWTEIANLNGVKFAMGSAGIQTASLVFGGAVPAGPGLTGQTEQWDGSSWTELSDMNTAREYVQGNGLYTDALGYGGSIPSPQFLTLTEFWNGSSWTEVADLSNGVSNAAGAGSTGSDLGLNFGGALPSYSTVTEEWTAPSVFSKITEGQLYFNSTTNTFKETILDTPGGTWSSGGTMNNDERYFSGGAGIKTAAIAFGGDSPQINKTESYNGTSWTEVNNLNTTKNYVSGAGTYTAALCINGYQNPPNVDLNQVESWDGTNWTEITETNETANAGNVSCGTQTAALITMRSPTPIAGRTELWNGSAWTETTDLNTARPNGAVFGISTSALASAGSPGATYTKAESWDGSAWTEVGDVNLGRQSLGSAGANNLSGIIFAGNRPGASSPAPGYTEAQRTEFWNGTSWTEINDMSTDRAGGSSSKSGGSATSAHAAGGNAPPYTGVTEEWTVDLTNKTITAS
jgi:hypothetical protein